MSAQPYRLSPNNAHYVDARRNPIRLHESGFPPAPPQKRSWKAIQIGYVTRDQVRARQSFRLSNR